MAVMLQKIKTDGSPEQLAQALELHRGFMNVGMGLEKSFQLHINAMRTLFAEVETVERASETSAQKAVEQELLHALFTEPMSDGSSPPAPTASVTDQ